MEEARIIRHEERKADRGPDQASLWFHRVGPLRSESRSTQVAYAFARGFPYEQCEKPYVPPDAKRVAAIVRSLTQQEALPHDIEAWMKE
jgi:hypothetical protein